MGETVQAAGFQAPLTKRARNDCDGPMIEIGQLLLLLFVLILMPFVLIVATPFVLLWPRPKAGETYVRTVFRRYGRIVDILTHIGNAIG